MMEPIVIKVPDTRLIPWSNFKGNWVLIARREARDDLGFRIPIVFMTSTEVRAFSAKY